MGNPGSIQLTGRAKLHTVRRRDDRCKKRAMRALLCAALTALVMLGASATEARMLKVVGYLEDAVILPVGLAIKAKMDTGADATAIHALNIERYLKDGRDWVSFVVDTGDRKMRFRRAVERIAKIVRAGTAMIERPVVRLRLCIAGYSKLAEVNLADRSNMGFPLLVGRKYMKTGGLVIDSGQRYAGNPVCPEASK